MHVFWDICILRLKFWLQAAVSGGVSLFIHVCACVCVSRNCCFLCESLPLQHIRRKSLGVCRCFISSRCKNRSSYFHRRVWEVHNKTVRQVYNLSFRPVNEDRLHVSFFFFTATTHTSVNHTWVGKYSDLYIFVLFVSTFANKADKAYHTTQWTR